MKRHCQQIPEARFVHLHSVGSFEVEQLNVCIKAKLVGKLAQTVVDLGNQVIFVSVVNQAQDGSFFVKFVAFAGYVYCKHIVLLGLGTPRFYVELYYTIFSGKVNTQIYSDQTWVGVLLLAKIRLLLLT